MPPVDVSVDFDFFVKEDLNRDWGHDEVAFFLEMIWNLRAMSLRHCGEDLRQVAPLMTQDFRPLDIVQALRSKGLEINRRTKVFVAESHARAYLIHKCSGNPLVVLDAHCDVWEKSQELDCSNWLRKLIEEKAIPSAINIFPTWKSVSQGTPVNGFKIKKIRRVQWDKLKPRTRSADVSNLTLIRSGCWVPPHHDPEFFYMVKAVLDKIGNSEAYFIDEWITKPRRVLY